MDALTDIGLTENESRVIAALSRIGQSSVGQLSSETALHRRSVYDVLERLKQKGLVRSAQLQGREAFTAAPPREVRGMLDAKTQNAVEFLAALAAQPKGKREVEVLEGDIAMKVLFTSFLDHKGELVVLGATGKANERLKYFMPRLHRRMRKAKNPVRILKNPGAKGFDSAGDFPRWQIKELPKESRSPVQFFVWGDRTGIALWSENPLLILIRSEEVASGIRTYFDWMWKTL